MVYLMHMSTTATIAAARPGATVAQTLKDIGRRSVVERLLPKLHDWSTDCTRQLAETDTSQELPAIGPEDCSGSCCLSGKIAMGRHAAYIRCVAGNGYVDRGKRSTLSSGLLTQQRCRNLE